MIFRAKINKGLDFGSEFNESRWQDFLKQNEGKWVRIEREEPKRTLSQNAYYWIYLEVISRETGNSPEDLHEFFKARFLPKKIIKIKGKKNTHEFTRTISTAKLNKLDFGEYLDKICSETEIPLPDPAEAGYFTR